MMKRLWGKLMENGQKFLDELRVTLENLNNQKITSTNASAQPQEDVLGNLIRELEDQEKYESLFNVNARDDSTQPTKPSTPKVDQGIGLTVPVVTQPSRAAPASAETLVTTPATSNKPKTNVTPVKPFSGKITPEVLTQFSNQYRVRDPKVTEAILKAAKTAGTDPDILFRFARAESNFNPTAKAKTSSATGLFQFLDKTWNYVLNDLGGKTTFNMKGNRKDPFENALGATIYLNEIKKNLAPARKSGEFTVGELYLGHFAGPPTARKVLKLIDEGKGNKPASAVFRKNQIEANKPIFYKQDGSLRSLSEVLERISSRVS